jgi:MAF protein
LSRLKAEAVATKLKQSASALSSRIAETDQLFIIAADTEVALDSQILGKPGSAAAATAMLKALRRQPHHVYSGLTIARLSGADLTFVTRLHQSTVWMRPYTNAEIAAYVASGDPLDKAGAYGIQNKSFAPVARLKGCFASVMGLPLGELAAAFQKLGLLLPSTAQPCSRYTGHPCCQEQS